MIALMAVLLAGGTQMLAVNGYQESSDLDNSRTEKSTTLMEMVWWIRSNSPSQPSSSYIPEDELVIRGDPRDPTRNRRLPPPTPPCVCRRGDKYALHNEVSIICNSC